MASLPVEVLLGIYLGVLTGIIPALVSWGLAFVFKYVISLEVPQFAVVALAIALAGLNGGLLALVDPSVTQSANAPAIVTGVVVVAMMAMYAHNRGTAMATDFPKRLSLSKLRERTLSADVRLPGSDEVRVRIVGDVADMEGYPPLSEDLRSAIRDSEWTFPADLRISELEERLAERLRTEHDLGDVAVSLDEKGRASVVAAPPFSGLSKRVPGDRRAVSIEALIPTGLARGDEVRVITADAQVRGTVVSARTHSVTHESGPDPDRDPLAGSGDEDGGDEETSTPSPVRAPTTTGGEGRLTVAVTRTDVQPLLRADRARVIVESRGNRREYELVSLLRRMGRRFRRLTIERVDDGLGVGTVGQRYGVTVLAVRGPDGWTISPPGDRPLAAGDEVYAVGNRGRLDEFTEAVT
jgi:hypothetical protein